MTISEPGAPEPGSRPDDPAGAGRVDGRPQSGATNDGAAAGDAPTEGAPTGGAPTRGAPTGDAERVERRSGLRDPAAAVRGLGAGTLAMEAIVLLLAIQPIRVLGGDLSGWGIATVIVLALLAAALAGSMRRRWAWHAGAALQVLLLCAGLLHWSLGVLGLIFGAVWAYASHVRRTLLS